MCCKPCLVAGLILATLSCGGDDDGVVAPENLNCAPAIIAFPANVTSTFPNASCLVEGDQARFLKFTTTGGEVRFDVDADGNAFTPEIAVHKEGSEEFVVFGGGGGSSFGTWSVPAGTYVLRVVAVDGTAGPFSVNGTSTITGCLPRALLSFATATYNNRIETQGNTSTGDCTFPDRNYDTFLVYSARSCTITMRGALDAELSVSNYLTRALISTDDNSAGGTDARITMPSCRASGGPLEITATVSDAGASTSGAYTLTVEVNGGIAAQR
jgi:hypothetical protein